MSKSLRHVLTMHTTTRKSKHRSIQDAVTMWTAFFVSASYWVKGVREGKGPNAFKEVLTLEYDDHDNLTIGGTTLFTAPLRATNDGNKAPSGWIGSTGFI